MLIVGPCFSGRIYLAGKELEEVDDTEEISKRRSREQYSDLEIERKIRETSESGGGVAIFDDMPEYNQEESDQFFTRWRPRNLNV